MPGEQLLLINPRRRRRRAKSHKRARRHVARRHHTRRRRAHTFVAKRRRHVHRNPRHVRRRRHRNPVAVAGMNGLLMPVAIGAVGAVGIDILWGYLQSYFGTLFSASPILNVLAKAGVAVAAGYGAGKLVGRQKGRYIMAGALTVYGYELVESLVKQFAPTLPFAGGMGAYMKGLGSTNYNPAPYLGGPMGRVGAYVPDSLNGLGGVAGGATSPEMGMF